MDNFCVYSYRDPRQELPFYIGKGRPDRPYKHLCDCFRLTRTHFYNRLNKLLAEGISPIIEIVASGLPEQSADGVSGGHWIHKEVRTNEHCAKMARPRSKEAKVNMKAGCAHRCRPVESYDLDTGKTIKQYAAVKDVVKDSFCRKAVTQCLSGKTKSSGYLGWRYL